ncbi:unnamed protein product [Clonostachys rosea f. rosea IK726]|uniref:Uncharacterized protein n=1 Tax=Clonostachys rosea f. rosea IK726 TaxID=1349383 RepID=A0ACA9ULL5_BIOOC|nr:unnamed protein product [Clonostachys rosea f. rosea IK726]
MGPLIDKDLGSIFPRYVPHDSRQAAEDREKVRGDEDHIIELGKLFPSLILCDIGPHDIALLSKTRKGLPLTPSVG